MMLKETIHQQHLDLQELFLQHQEALLLGEFEQAKVCLEGYRQCLQAHMQLEEQHVFPAFTTIERKSRWDVSVYEQEHEKINSLYETLVTDLTWLMQQQLNASQKKRNIIALLDHEKTFKGLTEHHEEREEDALLQELDEQLDQKIIGELITKLDSAWKQITSPMKR